MPRFFRGLLIVPLALSAASFRLPTTAHAVGRRVSMISVSKGEVFACAVTAPGAVVFCWGASKGACSGRLSRIGARRRASRFAAPASSDSIVAVSAGATPFACALSASGSAQCWGATTMARSVMARRETSARPRGCAPSEPLASISAGENMACGLTRDGRASAGGSTITGNLASATRPCIIFPSRSRHGSVSVSSASARPAGPAVCCWMPAYCAGAGMTAVNSARLTRSRCSPHECLRWWQRNGSVR